MSSPFVFCMKRWVIISLTFLWMTNLFAQELKLYTMEGCGNCAYAKKQLKEERIPYLELPVSDKKNETSMLALLQSKGCNANEFTMPVILLNNQLVHPFMQTDTGSVQITLDDALQYIIRKCGTSVETDKYKKEYYLVCGEFNSMSRVNHFIKVLEMDGYPYAGYYEENGIYYVYALCLSDWEETKRQYEAIKKQYRGTHIVSF